MLNQAQIQVGCLIVWTGFIVGGGLIVADAVLGLHDLSRFGLAAIIFAATYSVRRKLDVHDRALWDAFARGRAASREPDLHSLR